MVEEKNNQILIVKKKRTQDRMTAKIRTRKKKGFAPDQYLKVFNPHDFNDLALLFEDLDLIIGAPVEKAIRKYKENKGKGFPFY